MTPQTRVSRMRWPGWPTAGAAFGLGAVMASGQAPLGIWGLALAALAALILLITRAGTARGAGLLGLFAGAGHFMLALSWIVEPFLVDPETYAWMIPFVLLLMPFGLGLFWGVAAMCAFHFAHTQATRGLLLAVTLALAELARGYILTGFPWALIGHIWVDTSLAQVAAIVGPNGLTFLTTLAAALPVAFRFPGGIAAALMLAASFGFGHLRLAEPDPVREPVTIRLVQPNAEQHLKWEADRALLFFNRLLELTARHPAPGEPSPDLVIWPETAVPYLLEPDGPVLRAMAEAGQGVPLAVGIQRRDGTRAYNSLAVIGADALVQQIYDKHHLVPFGEYIPFGDLAHRLFGISAFASQQGAGYTAGPGPVLLDLGGKLGTALPLICYEAVFPQDMRADAGRADWLMQITNDAWFGKLTGPWQHLAQARLRAIEQGLPLLRAANTGISAVVDAKGRVVATLPLGVAGNLDVALPAALADAPPYARFGDFPLFVLLVGLFTLLLAIQKAKRA